jgi:hypothetical protein
MATITDNFDRANNASSLGSSSEGWSWTAVAGTWGINNNLAYAPGASTTQTARAEIDLDSADHYAQVVYAARSTGDFIGPAVRFASAADTCYYYKSNSNVHDLLKRVAGVPTSLATGSTSSLALPHTLKAEINGSTLKGFREGVEM